MGNSVKQCSVCGMEFASAAADPVYAEAGEWLSEEVWQDGGSLCPQCLENRARLAMMCLHEYNT